jgi:putative ABC transport system permease protein
MALSIFFISATLIVYKQIVYMRNADMGINFHQVITITAPASLNIDSTKRRRFLSFREDLLHSSEFKAATANTFTPGQSPRYGNNEFIRPAAGIRPSSLFFENNGDDGLIETFRLKLIAGRNFSPVPSLNAHRVIINERSVKEFGFKNPEEAIGSFVRRTGRDTVPIEIIGVLADFNNEGLQKPIYPMIYNNGHPFEFGYYSVRLNTRDVNKALAHLKEIWTNHYPSDQMNYVFADEFFFRQYQSEERFGKFYTLLTILSLAISCLGLFGLIMFYLGQKSKEIGIRKINGAKINEVILMLIKDIAIWLTIAFMIASPVAWYVMNKWLENFAFKTDLSWWIFALAGFVTLCIALLTVSWQSWRAATRNPVEALRYE